MICSENKLRDKGDLSGLIHVTYFKVHTKVVKITHLSWGLLYGLTEECWIMLTWGDSAITIKRVWIGEAEDLSTRSNPEELIQFHTVFSFGAAAAAAGATEKVAKGLYGLQSFPATGFRSGLWVPRMPPWLAIWLVLISHVGCRQGTYFKAESIIWQRRKFTASQMSSLALINLFINSIIIY